MSFMNRRSRIMVFFLGVILVLLIVLYLLVDAVTLPEEEVIVYPQGELVDSVFVAQNSEYVKNDSLNKTHIFETVPYSVDVPDSNSAKIGTGTIYQLSTSYFVYVTEYTDQYDVQSVIASQFPVALLINYIPESTRITVNAEKAGYINGFRAKYVADSLFVSDGSVDTQAMVLGYALDLPEGVYYGNHMFIAVGTTSMDTESANKCSAMLSAIMKTVKYDEKYERDLKQKKEAAEKAQKEALDSASQENTQEEQMSDNAAPTTSVVGDEVTETIPIVVPMDYSQFTLTVDWTLNNPAAVLEFFMPDGLSYATPLEQTAYSATFSLSNLPQGTYQLRIMYYQQCGDIAPTISGTPANTN